MNRVVITGMAGLSPLGNDEAEIWHALQERKNAISVMRDWDEIRGLRTRLAGLVKNFAIPEHYTRKRIRSMGRVALLATRATELALTEANLLGEPEVQSGSMGVAYGSSVGSTPAMMNIASIRFRKEVKEITSTTYLQMMSHTCATHVALFFGVQGRIIPTSSACTSGSQAIGYAYEAIKHGDQMMMIAGGAEEMCVSIAAVFDVLYATSTQNDRPEQTPRPFDRKRDGLVVSEGACSLILEDLAHALARGATIYAEVVGFGTNCDGRHITAPVPESMQKAMNLSLESARLSPAAIGYVNAHATATDQGDMAESQATHAVFGERTPISSLKSYMGHTLGASGALESWMTIQMMNRNWYAPTINLEEIDSRCAPLDYMVGEGRSFQSEYVMNNNFAFGGINTSIIFKRWGN